MKAFCIFVTIVLVAIAPIFLWSAENGAALYNSKCSMCHGDKGEGNPPSIPKVAGTSMTVDQLVTYLTADLSYSTAASAKTSGISFIGQKLGSFSSLGASLTPPPWFSQILLEQRAHC